MQNVSRTTIRRAAMAGLLLPAALWAAPQVHQAEVAQAGMQARLEAGRETYESYCQACHQADGRGMGTVFPPLAGSDYLLADRERAIAIVLEGLSGPIEVNGQPYNSVMPHLAYLSDQQVADVVSYTLNAWGNDGGYVGTDEVAARRAALAGTPAPKAVRTRGSRRRSFSTKAVRRARWVAPRCPGWYPRRPGNDRGRVPAGHPTLLRALCRLSRRAAQGRDRQAADPGPDARQGHPVPVQHHQYGTPAWHAELGLLG
jgi:mono/diheme cytochrome c family protein